MKKPKIDAKISNHVRKLWLFCDERKTALLRTRRPCLDGSRKKWMECCEVCGRTAYIGEKEFKIKKDGSPSKVKRSILAVHHINEVPNVWAPDFLKRLFCPASELQIVCNKCHDDIHSRCISK